MIKPHTHSRGRIGAFVVISILLLLGSGTYSVHGELRRMEPKQLRSIDGREGLRLELGVNASADYLEITDPNGTDGTTIGPGVGSSGALRLGGFSLSNGNNSQFTTLTLDADGADGVVFSVPSSDANFNLSVDQFTVPDNPNNSSLNSSHDAGALQMENLNITGSNILVSATNDGFELDGEIDASADNFIYDDADGGDAQFLLESPRISESGFGSAYDFTGLSVDLDQNGIAISPPSEAFSLDASGVCVEDFGSSSCSDEEYIAEDLEVDELGLDQSSFLLSGNEYGLELEGQIRFTIDEIILDDDGSPRDFNSSNAEVIFNSIHFTSISTENQVGSNDSGGAVSINTPAELHVERDEGVFLKLPGFDTSGGTFDIPANELYIQNISVEETCSSSCGDWSIRNLDVGGSWVNIQGRN